MSRWMSKSIGIWPIILGVAIITTTIISQLGYHSSVSKDTPADPALAVAAEKAKAAATEFAVLAKDSARTGNVPRQTDPAARQLLDAVFNVGIVQAKPNLGVEDLIPLNDWLKTVLKAGSIYMFAGTGITDYTTAVDDAVQHHVDRNIVGFAPETGRMLDAQAVLMDAEADVVARNKSDTANEKLERAKEKMSNGMASMIEYLVGMASVSGVDDEWRRQRVRSAASLAASSVKLLQPTQCSRLRDIAATAGRVAHEASVRLELNKIAEVLKC